MPVIPPIGPGCIPEAGAAGVPVPVVAGVGVAVFSVVGVAVWAKAETVNSTKNSDKALPYLMIGVIFDIVKLTFL